MERDEKKQIRPLDLLDRFVHIKLVLYDTYVYIKIYIYNIGGTTILENPP